MRKQQHLYGNIRTSNTTQLTQKSETNNYTSKLASQIEIIYECVFSNKGGHVAYTL